MNRANKRTKGSSGSGQDAGDTSGDILDLSALFHTRISQQAKEILRQRAAAAAMPPGTFGRHLLYRALGIIKPGVK
jgi:hypothetical protein